MKTLLTFTTVVVLVSVWFPSSVFAKAQRVGRSPAVEIPNQYFKVRFDSCRYLTREASGVESPASSEFRIESSLRPEYEGRVCIARAQCEAQQLAGEGISGLPGARPRMIPMKFIVSCNARANGQCPTVSACVQARAPQRRAQAEPGDKAPAATPASSASH